MFKLNIAGKGKTFKIETDSESLVGKKIGETIEGNEVSKELDGYNFEITGTSDLAGFPGKKDVEGAFLKRVLLTKGFGLKTKPKGLSKKPVAFPDGLRMKKTVRGNTISRDVIQINLKILKAGHKKLEEIFPEQNQPKPKEEKPVEAAEQVIPVQ